MSVKSCFAVIVIGFEASPRWICKDGSVKTFLTKADELESVAIKAIKYASAAHERGEFGKYKVITSSTNRN